MYFCRMQHSYHNLNIRPYLRLHYINVLYSLIKKNHWSLFLYAALCVFLSTTLDVHVIHDR
jgi:hypothetical protein